MLFHALHDPESDVYFGQAHWPIHGPLDLRTFTEAWQQVVDRHTILRTSFEWISGSGPVQRVHAQAVVPMDSLDWRMLPRDAQAYRLTRFLQMDRARGFDLTRPPLLRITGIRLSDNKHHIVWSAHHLLVDGRSIHLIVREVMALYAYGVAGTPVTLPTPIPYSRFASWLDERNGAAAEVFWRKALLGFSSPTSFGSDGGSKREKQIRATESEQIRLTAEARAALRSLARSSDVTVNTVIMAAWALLCSRYSRSQDVVYGVTIGSGGKGAPLNRALAGLMINTLPLRLQVVPSDTTVALLQQVRAALAEIKRYASSPLVDVVRWSDVPSETALFDHIVVFDNSSLDRLTGQYGALELGRLTIEQDSSYPLNLVVQTGSQLVLKLLYAPAHIDRDMVRRLLGQLEHVVVGMAAEPERDLGDLSAMPQRERREVLGTWNTTSWEQAPSTTLHLLFEQQANRTPAALAVVCGSDRLTFAQLDDRATAMAHLLRARGVGPESIVGIAVDRSVDLIVGVIAIAKAGGACLFLDPHAPAHRLASILDDAGASICLTWHSIQDRLPQMTELLYLDDDVLNEIGHYLPVTSTSDRNLAYVVYTSGTTGEPKGVAIEHRNAVNLIFWHIRAFGISTADRVTQVASVGFDALIWEIWPNLAAGACIHIPSDEIRGDPARLQRWLLEQQITVTFLPTPLAETLLIRNWPKHTPLRIMLVGGDVLHLRPAPSLPFEVVNNYGPSECTVVATSGVVRPASEEGNRLPEIGRPIDHAQMYLLDETLQAVPVGVPGELYIGGSGVGRGYLNRPELTAQRFIAHPFSEDPTARLYKSGDLARYRSDGTIEFMGRLDDQIQLRGFRIEPGEIEAALRRHPGIRDAAVRAHEAEGGNSILAAYLVLADGGSLSTSAVREHLETTLPSYMVPTLLSTVDAIPLSPHGKVDRAALSSLLPLSHSASLAPAAAPNSAEELLITIWKETLKLDAVGVHDNFFELGGNSLLAIELLENIRHGLSCELSLSDLFRAPTIHGLAEMCGRFSSVVSHGALVPIQPLGSRPPFFCVAPVLGTVFPYYELAHIMSNDQPFYGLQPVDVSGSRWTIESLAASYIRAIQQTQRTGPYYLGGWSFGGLVAFEMAQQLQRAGEATAALVVLDTPAPGLQHYLGVRQSLRVIAQTVVGGAWEYLRDYGYLAGGSRERPTQTRSASTHLVSLLRLRSLGASFLNRASVASVVPAESRLLLYHLPTVREMFRLLRTGVMSTLRYRPSVYSGRVTLLRTDAHGAEGAHSSLLGWDTVSNWTVQVRPIPGNHLTVLRQPHTPVVAEVLEAVLDAAQREQESTLSLSVSLTH